MTLRSLGSRSLPRRPPQQGHFYPLVQGRNGSDRVLFDYCLAIAELPGPWMRCLQPAPLRGSFCLTAAAI
jgi:hypothetical protein